MSTDPNMVPLCFTWAAGRCEDPDYCLRREQPMCGGYAFAGDPEPVAPADDEPTSFTDWLGRVS